MDGESDEHSGNNNRHSREIKITDDKKCSSIATLVPNSEPLPFPFLPFELNTEILQRVPVKSLSRFKCVSRSWLSFIAMPQFIKAHLAASSKNGECAYSKFIFTILPPNTNLKVCSLRSVVSEPDTEPFEVDYPMKSTRRYVIVVGYCQGLVCYSVEWDLDMFLWNPSTGLSKKLPYSDTEFKNRWNILYGFGYDEKNQDYKAVRIFRVNCGRGVYNMEVMVYSLKRNSWRRTRDFEKGVPLDISGKYANGKLHWTAARSLAPGNQWKIISLDLADESYEEVNQPDYGNGVTDRILGVLDGCLSVLCYCPRNCADLWVMKQYGSQESWTKLASIPYENSPGNGRYSMPSNSRYSMPLCMLKNGEILLMRGSIMVIYNSKQKCFRYPQLQGLDTNVDVGMYVESLVSPNSCDETERQHQ